jgi:hypothetical protein
MTVNRPVKSFASLLAANTHNLALGKKTASHVHGMTTCETSTRINQTTADDNKTSTMQHPEVGRNTHSATFSVSLH